MNKDAGKCLLLDALMATNNITLVNSLQENVSYLPSCPVHSGDQKRGTIYMISLMQGPQRKAFEAGVKSRIGCLGQNISPRNVLIS